MNDRGERTNEYEGARLLDKRGRRTNEMREEVRRLMLYDDPTRRRGGQGPDDDTTGQKGGQTGTEDSLGDIGEGLGDTGGMTDVTTEDEVEDIDKAS